MSFTYTDPTSTIGTMRRYIGDTVKDDGPRPDGRNFSDEELNAFLSDMGRVTYAIAAAFEALKAEWSSAALLDKQGDDTLDARSLPDHYEKLAEKWYNKTTLSETGRTIGIQVYSEYDSGTSGTQS